MTLHTLNNYGADFQIKAISSLLTHKEFLTNIHDIINEDFFENSAHRWCIKEILRYYDKYHTTPSLEVLKVELQKVDNDVLQLSIKEQLKLAYVSSDEDLKYVQEEFTNFCRNQQLKKALMSSVDLLKAGDFDGIRHIVDGALRAGQDKNVGHEYIKDIEERYRENSRTVISTPWDRINNILQGGLGNGDFGLIFGSPGGGKSWSLVALGGYAVRLGYNVLHYTLELGEAYVGKRYDAFFTNIPVNETERLRGKAEEVIPQLPGQLIIKEFPTGRATMSTIESHIKKVEGMGVKADLVIIDYVDLLSSGRKNRERKDEIDDIYTSTKGLARELDIPIWSVSQVNRAGANDEIIEGDKAAGSYDKLMISDFAMSLSRKKEDKVNNTGRFHIMKNRYGIDGLTFAVKADTSTGHFEVHNYNTDLSEDEHLSTPVKSNKFDTDVDRFDRAKLKKAYDPGFFELKK
ncbi:AAA family ATPase [Robiginitalea sp.]|nr:AAA family ATPase [Robiginitalea sp.]